VTTGSNGCCPPSRAWDTTACTPQTFPAQIFPAQPPARFIFSFGCFVQNIRWLSGTNHIRNSCLQQQRNSCLQAFFAQTLHALTHAPLPLPRRYAEKTREAMGAEGQVDGCALCWRSDKLFLRDSRVVSFNAKAMQLEEQLPKCGFARKLSDPRAFVCSVLMLAPGWLSLCSCVSSISTFSLSI